MTSSRLEKSQARHAPHRRNDRLLLPRQPRLTGRTRPDGSVVQGQEGTRLGLEHDAVRSAVSRSGFAFVVGLHGSSAPRHTLRAAARARDRPLERPRTGRATDRRSARLTDRRKPPRLAALTYSLDAAVSQAEVRLRLRPCRRGGGATSSTSRPSPAAPVPPKAGRSAADRYLEHRQPRRPAASREGSPADRGAGRLVRHGCDPGSRGRPERPAGDLHRSCRRRTGRSSRIPRGTVSARRFSTTRPRCGRSRRSVGCRCRRASCVTSSCRASPRLSRGSTAAPTWRPSRPARSDSCSSTCTCSSVPTGTRPTWTAAALETYAIARWADLRRKKPEGVHPQHRPPRRLQPTPGRAGRSHLLGAHQPWPAAAGSTRPRSDRASPRTSHYDQIAFFPGETKQDFTGQAGVFDFDGAVFPDLWRTRGRSDFLTFSKYYLSDHRPLWAEFRI